MDSAERHLEQDEVGVQSLSLALPAIERSASESILKKKNISQTTADEGSFQPSTLPPCFAEVWRRRSSSLDVHQKERAALEAVAATVPTNKISLSDPSAGASVYLAALIISLRRINATVDETLKRSSGGWKDESSESFKKRTQRIQKSEKTDAIGMVDDLHAVAKSAAILSENVKNRSQDSVLSDGKDGIAENISLMASLLYLIGLALRDASPAIVNARCEDILGCIVTTMEFGECSATIGRHAATSLAGSLSLLESVLWKRPFVQRSYLKLVELSMSEDSKTRRKSREVLSSLVSGGKRGVIQATTSGRCATQVISILQRLRNKLSNSTATGVATSYERSSLIHVITSVVLLAPSFLPSDIGLVTKELLILASSSLPIVSLHAFNALSSLCSKEGSQQTLKSCKEVMPHDKKEETSDSRSEPKVSTSQMGRMVKALAEIKMPSNCDEESICAYANCLSTVTLSYCEAHAFSPPPSQLMASSVKSLVECVDPIISGPGSSRRIVDMLKGLSSHKWLSAKPDVFVELKALFGYRYKSVWETALAPLRLYLESHGCAGVPLMLECVNEFAQSAMKLLKHAKASNDKHTVVVVEAVLCAILRGGGVASILGAAPLEREKKLLLSNAWLLPILQGHIRHSSLAIFMRELRPLAEDLQDFAKKASQDGRVVESKNADMLGCQVWSLLPAFCQTPSDISQDSVVKETFAAFELCIKEGLTSRNTGMFQIGIGGLRSLSLSFSNIPSDDQSYGHKRKLFAKHLKLIYPALCEAAEDLESNKRAPVLEAVSYAAKACDDAKLIASLLRKTLRRLLEASVPVETEAPKESMDLSEEGSHVIMSASHKEKVRHAAADIAIALAESGALSPDCAEMDILERAMLPLFLDPSDSLLQKKAYRAVGLMTAMGVVETKADIGIRFIEMAASASSSIAPSAKASRLNFIKSLVEPRNSLQLTRDVLEKCTTSFMPEIVLGTRDVSEKSRTASFAALSSLSRAWYLQPGDDNEGLRSFLRRLAAGLAGRTVAMLAATLSSFGHVLFLYRGEASLCHSLANDFDAFFGVCSNSAALQNDPDIGQTMGAMESDASLKTQSLDGRVCEPGPVSILLRHSAKEVQKAALGVVKTATSALTSPVTRLVNVLPAILPGLVNAAAKSKKKELRLRVRVILERLLRKCGRDNLEAFFPAEHQKLLSAVRKQYSRELVKKHKSKLERQQSQGNETKKSRPEKAARIHASVVDADSDGSSEIFIDDSDSDLEKEILDGDVLSRRRASENSSAVQNLRIRDGQEDAVDLLESEAVGGFLIGEEASRSMSLKGTRAERARKGKRDRSMLKTADDGRPIFEESEEGRGNNEPENDDQDCTGDTEPFSPGRESRKKRRVSNGDVKRRIKGSFGEEYRSRRGALGDMKRPGRPDPYAYVPLGGKIGVSAASKSILRRGRRHK